MARGRKKVTGAKRELISIRLTEQQKEIINKNKWIKKELDEMVRNYLNVFTVDNL